MMKDKEKILLYACWAVLIAYFLIKMLGGNYFEIACENERFIAFCNWLDNSWFKFVISIITYTTSMYMIYLCIVKKKILNDWWMILVMLPASVIKYYNPIIGLVLDFIYIILIPLIISKGKLWKRVIVGNVLMFAFQLISLITKNIGYYYDNSSMLVGLIYMIDYYLMIILYYLYTHRKKET